MLAPEFAILDRVGRRWDGDSPTRLIERPPSATDEAREPKSLASFAFWQKFAVARSLNRARYRNGRRRMGANGIGIRQAGSRTLNKRGGSAFAARTANRSLRGRV